MRKSVAINYWQHTISGVDVNSNINKLWGVSTSFGMCNVVQFSKCLEWAEVGTKGELQFLKRANIEAAAYHCSVAVLKMFFELGVPKDFAIFREKHLFWSLFLKKFQACDFPVNIAKFLATPFFIKRLWWLLLKNS